MRFEDLPGIPGIWLEFLRGQVPEVPLTGTIQGLTARADMFHGRSVDRDLICEMSAGLADSPLVNTSIQRLAQPGAVVVSTVLNAELFGGSVGQILKCLTAVKVCEHLTTHRINAVPLAWIETDSACKIPNHSVCLMDGHGELRRIEVPPGEMVPESIFSLISEIKDLGAGCFDPETLDALKKSFRPGRSFSASTASLFSELMRDWGMIVIDPTAHRSSCIETGAPVGTQVLPVLASVVGPFEIESTTRVWSEIDKAGLPRPTAWPQASATIGDIRSRRTFDKYRLSLAHLFRGDMDVIDRIRRDLPRAGLKKLEDLESEVEEGLRVLGSLGSGRAEFSRGSHSCRERVLYQIRKLRRLFGAALESKEQTANSRVRKACNLMAPNGRLQERELACIQIPLSYSTMGLRILYEKLNISTFEHQLIWMD